MPGLQLPQFLLLIDGRSWLMGACADSDAKRSFSFLPNFPPPDKTKAAPEAPRKTRCGRRRRARGWSPYREIYKGNLLSAELVGWTASVNRRICSAASIEIIYGAAGFFFSLNVQVLAALPQTRESINIPFISCSGDSKFPYHMPMMVKIMAAATIKRPRSGNIGHLGDLCRS